MMGPPGLDQILEHHKLCNYSVLPSVIPAPDQVRGKLRQESNKKIYLMDPLVPPEAGRQARG